MDRFTLDHVAEWRHTGFTVIERFFSPDEYQPLLADFAALYGDPAARASHPRVVGEGAPDADENYGRQFENIHALPYDGSPALNLISLHPQLIAFAKALLGVEDVRLYQSHTWAKFTGEADYEQDFHCDYGNHTLVVPSEEVRHRCADFIFYLTDVTSGHGALRYVTKQDVEEVLGAFTLDAPDPTQQRALRERERLAVVPAGSLVAHGIDTMHRGTNLTVAGSYRLSMTVGYKAAGNDAIGYHVWQTGHGRPWHHVMNHASPAQLACLGIPPPGDAYWTARTLRAAQARWPQWDMSAYVR